MIELFKPQHFEKDNCLGLVSSVKASQRANELLPQLLEKRYIAPGDDFYNATKTRHDCDTHYVLCTKPVAIEQSKHEKIRELILQKGICIQAEGFAFNRYADELAKMIVEEIK